MKSPLLLRLVAVIWRYVMTIYLMIGVIAIIAWAAIQGHTIPASTSSAGKLLLAGIGLSLTLTVLGNAAVAIAIEGMLRGLTADRIALGQAYMSQASMTEQDDSA